MRAEGLGGLQVDAEIEPREGLRRQIGGLGTLGDLVSEVSGTPAHGEIVDQKR